MTSFRFQDGDWRLAGTGKLERVSGTDLLLQHVDKIQNTDKQNPVNEYEIPFRYNPNYGQNLKFIRSLNPIFTVEDALQAVKNDIREMLIKYAQIQRNKQTLRLAPEETLVDASIITTLNKSNTDGVERYEIKYELELINAAGQSTNFEKTAFSR